MCIRQAFRGGPLQYGTIESQIRNNRGGIRSEGSRGRPDRISELLPVEPKRYLEIMDSSSSGKSCTITQSHLFYTL